MQERRSGCAPLTLLLIVMALTAFYTTVTIGMFDTIRSAGTTTTAEAVKVSGTILYNNADAVKVTYDFNGKTYKGKILAEKGSVKEGDKLTVYCSKKTPRACCTDDMIEIESRTVRIYYMIFGILLVLRIIVGITSRARSHRSEKMMESFNDSADPVWNDFFQSFLQSLQFKNVAMLSSALRERERALDMVRGHRDYESLAYHNLQVLKFMHCCDGIGAYADGKKSLEYKTEYRELSDRKEPVLRYSSYEESLIYTAMLAKSHDEARELLKEVVERNKVRTAVKQAKEMLESMEKTPRWFDFQRGCTTVFYSRHSAAEDKGDYSPACAMLQLMLSRADDRGYDLTEEEYVDMLDDYLVVALKYFTLRSNVLLQNGGAPEGELMFIVRNPLRVLIDFLPDCEEKRFKDVFRSVLREYETYDQPFSMFVSEYEQARKALDM